MNTVEVDSSIQIVSIDMQADRLNAVATFVEAALTRLGIDGWELSVLFCGDPFIANLNKQYRGIDSPTDVLSFSQIETTEGTEVKKGGLPAVGDIVISVDSLAGNAKEFDVPVDEELKRLLVHGILHLAGYDHTDTLDDSPQQEMLILQERVLTELKDYTIIKG